MDLMTRVKKPPDYRFKVHTSDLYATHNTTVAGWDHVDVWLHQIEHFYALSPCKAFSNETCISTLPK